MSNNSLEFLAVAKSSELWRYISAVIMTMTSEGQFEACPKGIEFRSKSCEAFIDIAVPSAVFQQFYSPILLKFGLRIAEFSKIIKRVDDNFPIEVCIEDRFIVITTIGAFFSCNKSNLIESSMRERCEGTYSLRLISDLLDSIGAASEHVQLEYSSGGTLRLKFLLLEYVTIHFYVAAHT
jgi:hypothetical protein